MSHSTLTRWLLSLCLLAPAVSQACNWEPNPVSLGTVTTQRVHTGEALIGTGSFNFKCVGTLLTLVGLTPSLNARFQGTATGLTLKNGAHAIPYAVYQNANQTGVVSGGLLLLTVPPATVLGLLTAGAGAAVPVYFVTQPGANIPAGVYQDTVQVIWTAANICEGLVVLGACVGNWTHGEKTSTMTITLTVSNDCTITAPTVDFGVAPLPAGFAPVTQNIVLLCSRDMVFSVGLSGGSQPSGGRRHMSAGGARLAYDIFKADQTVWGSAGGARAPGPGTADGTTVQRIPYTARVYPDQTSPPAGSYTDNVVVDVSF